jgi:Ser/Thr protein kinase RdoA (MazF antagonist)
LLLKLAITLYNKFEKVMKMKAELMKVLEEFQIEGKVLTVSPYGSGHINLTYLVETTAKRYILQKINHNLFKEVDKLMHNIEAVSEYNRKIALEKGKDPDRECLSLIYTKSGKSYLTNQEGYYRLYKYIEDSVCYQLVEKPEDFYESAVAFGSFAAMLSEFDASTLFEILPNFHNTPIRYDNFLKSLEKDILDRAKETEAEIEFIQKRKVLYSKIVDLLAEGKMPTKVTHNDTKLNNVLFHKDTGKALAVIDFDTIMPGSICYDFGDSIRFGCSTALEDERDLDKVHFRLDLFEEYVKGFLFALGSDLTEVEKDNLPYGAILMTIENGIRFLTDYLDGDTYFRTQRPQQNLDRCRTQLKLVSEMEANLTKMQEIVDKYYRIYCLKE